MKKNTIIMAVALTLLLTSCTEADADVYARFEERLETLRQRLKIPSFSAAIVKQQELVWAKGFGYADLENKIKATLEKPYHILANTDNLSRPYPLADGDAMQSSAALAFYRTFILEPRYDQPAPEIDWEAQQGDAVTLLSRYDDDDLRDLLTKERAAHMALLASYGRLAESAERIASLTVTDVDPEVFGKYVGQYEVPAELGAPFDTVAVTIDGQKLFLEIPDGPAMELYPQSESSFFFLERRQ